jgi:hypothetical protein
MTLNNGTIPEAELPSDFMTDVYLFHGTKEFIPCSFERTLVHPV